MTKLLKELISEFENREQRGFLKYGTTMDRTDLNFSQWLQHFKEELMDGLLYLQKIQNDYDTQRLLLPTKVLVLVVLTTWLASC